MQWGSQFRSRPFSGTLGSLRHMYPIAYVLCSASVPDEPRVVCFTCESISESAVTQVENNSWCRSVLKARMKNKCLHQGLLHDDIRTFRPSALGVANEARGAVGGFPCQACSLDRFLSLDRCQSCPPCQGISCAGAQGGLKDGRSGLLKECFRVFDELADPLESQSSGCAV